MVRLLSEVIVQIHAFNDIYNNNQFVISDMTPHDMYLDEPDKYKITEIIFTEILNDMRYAKDLNSYVENIDNNMQNPQDFADIDYREAIASLREIHDRFKNVLIKSHKPIRV